MFVIILHVCYYYYIGIMSMVFSFVGELSVHMLAVIATVIIYQATVPVDSNSFSNSFVTGSGATLTMMNEETSSSTLSSSPTAGINEL